MPCNIPPSYRNLLVRLFRAEVYRHTGFVEFPPQAEFRLATEGWELTSQVVPAPAVEHTPYDPSKLRIEDYPILPKPVKLLVPCSSEHVEAMRIGETDNYARYQWQLAVPRRYTRRNGLVETVEQGVVATRSSLLASFKMGKSQEVGLWAAGFACLPGATIDMIGLEYGTSEHEFAYLSDALLGGEKPLISPKMVKHHYNSVQQGNMLLELTNGCSFGVRSWKNKDRLRGGQITAYIFNEIYQLPGLEVFTGNAQNLRKEQGFAAFTSTPDRPWVKVLHKQGHGRTPHWHCTCDNTAFVNPFTFDLKGFMEDVPDWETIREHAPQLLAMCEESGLTPGALMSKEKFLISWLGRIGGFVGRVYSFSQEALTIYPHTHPKLFSSKVVEEWEDRRAHIVALQESALALQG